MAGWLDGLASLFGGGAAAGAVQPQQANPNVGILGSLGQFIKDKPEQTAMGLDAIGRNLDPNNAFAGIGGAWGQSSLANKARQEEVQQQQDWKKLVASILSGETKTTPAGVPGITGFSSKPGKDGGMNELTFKVDEPTSALAEQPKPNSINLSEVMSLSPF